MFRFRQVVLSALALATLSPAVAQADRYYYYPPPPPPPMAVSRPAWWYAGVGVVGTSILDQSGGPEALRSGGGLTAWIGVNLSRALSLEVGWLGSFHNPEPFATYYGPETSFLVLEGVTADAK